MGEILHHFELMVETTVCWYVLGNHQTPGFLNGGARLADFATIHSIYSSNEAKLFVFGIDVHRLVSLLFPVAPPQVCCNSKGTDAVLFSFFAVVSFFLFLAFFSVFLLFLSFFAGTKAWVYPMINSFPDVAPSAVRFTPASMEVSARNVPERVPSVGRKGW